MTLLSGLLYLMLILGGMAIGFIILDLNRAEDHAEQAINRLIAQAESVSHIRQPAATGPFRPVYPDAIKLKAASQSEAESSWSFQTISLPTGSSQIKQASVSFDFATATGRQTRNEEQALECLLRENQRTDCCA